MPGEAETAVETPAAPAAVEEVVEKKEMAEESENVDKKEEKKDAEKAEKEEKSPEKKKGGKTGKEKAVVPPPPAVHKKDFEKDVVYLYQFNRCYNLPSLSPYCLKTETWLKYHNIKYENVNHNSKLRSKKGLLPFVELNGEEIADSSVIIKTLSEKFEKNMDAGLNAEQKNVQHAMISMVDNHLLWVVAQWRSRHVDHILKGHKLNLQSFTGSKVPNGLLNFGFKYTFLRKMTRKVKAVGLGGFSNEEVDKMGENDLKVLSELLGEKQFFFGDEPASLDLHAFVVLASLIAVDKEVACPLRDFLESDCTNLVGFFNRMKDLTWGDHWDEATGEKMELNPHIPKPEPVVEEKKEEEKKEEEKEKADEKKDEKEKEETKAEKQIESDNKKDDNTAKENKKENKEKDDKEENKEAEEKK